MDIEILKKYIFCRINHFFLLFLNVYRSLDDRGLGRNILAPNSGYSFLIVREKNPARQRV